MKRCEKFGKNAFKLRDKHLILISTIYFMIDLGNLKRERQDMKKFPKFLAAGAMALTVLAGCGSEGAGSTVELKDGDTAVSYTHLFSLPPR